MAWKRKNIRFGFLSNLRAQFGTGEFTNADAYEVYRQKHSTARGSYDAGEIVMDYWTMMNARNTLCAAAKLGYLIRVGVAKYKFSPDYDLLTLVDGFYKHKVLEDRFEYDINEFMLSYELNKSDATKLYKMVKTIQEDTTGTW